MYDGFYFFIAFQENNNYYFIHIMMTGHISLLYKYNGREDMSTLDSQKHQIEKKQNTEF